MRRVKALSQIVTEFRAANDSEVSEIERQRASLKRGEGKGKKGAALPEAPAKQLLKQQILFFVDNLNSLRGGMDKNSSDLLASVPSTPSRSAGLGGRGWDRRPSGREGLAVRPASPGQVGRRAPRDPQGPALRNGSGRPIARSGQARPCPHGQRQLARWTK